VGPGDGLGKPRRAGARPPAGPLNQPQQDIAGSSPARRASAGWALVVLAVAGCVLAGAFGSWPIAGLRPADALAQVA